MPDSWTLVELGGSDPDRSQHHRRKPWRLSIWHGRLHPSMAASPAWRNSRLIANRLREARHQMIAHRSKSRTNKHTSALGGVVALTSQNARRRSNVLSGRTAARSVLSQINANLVLVDTCNQRTEEKPKRRGSMNWTSIWYANLCLLPSSVPDPLLETSSCLSLRIRLN